ncbi:MAG: ABC transporter ATP-binding protein [Limnochordaceae bacterium]|nr:ABC transporter ATP-binding protein [Limnochordaceae bacterium]
MDIVRIQGLVKRYPVPGAGRNGASASGITVLELSHLSVGPRTELVVAGPSGSGKTTLLNILAGLVRPSEGRVELLGQDLFALPEGRRDAFRARHVGYVFQTFNLIGSLSALDNVLLAMAVAGCVPKRERRRRALGLLEQVGMHHRLRHRPAQLSVGEQQRVAVARALANRPELVLADEPTANLDRRSAGAVLRVLRDAVAAEGATLIMATHDPRIIESAQEVLYLDAPAGAPVQMAPSGTSLAGERAVSPAS